MDALMLSRIQFGATAAFHFIFVPLTIGLIILVAVMETLYAKTKKPIYQQMSDFWGKLFAINFVLGVITGITMEFQIGMNWSEYSAYMGDIFGTPLAIVALVAFFLESTFMGIWWFGRKKLKSGVRVLSIWLVAIGTNLSSVWILTANGFMQNPVGYKINEAMGRIELESISDLLTNPYAWYMFFHTVLSAYIVGSFFVLAISAWHIARKSNLEFFKKSFKLAAIMAVISTIAVPGVGHQYGNYVAKIQPAKAAAMEAVWETTEGLGFSVFQIPRVNEEKNIEAFTIPKVGSFLYTSDFNGKVIGLKDIPEDERPNVNVVFYSFRTMVMVGTALVFIALYAFYLSRKNKLESSTRFLKVMPYFYVLPYVCIMTGWMVSEVGRQPWTVYGLMRTEDSVSPLATGQIWFSLITLGLFYAVLGAVDFYLILKYAKNGPEPITPDHKVADQVQIEEGTTHGA